MEIAYAGEVLTPSKCGRMDQCVAFGHRPVLMTFDGDLLGTRVLELPRGAAFCWLLVDLAGAKSTSRILEGLQDGCTSERQTAVQAGVRELLGPTNERIVKAAVLALEGGDHAAMGRLLIEAQSEFDAKAMPACPSELTAPQPHALLKLPEVVAQWGAKGVGSQGDGTAQVLCKSAKEREVVAAAIAKAWPEMDCMPLTLRHANDDDELQQAASSVGATVSANPLANGAAPGVAVTRAQVWRAKSRPHGRSIRDAPHR